MSTHIRQHQRNGYVRANPLLPLELWSVSEY